jgi:phosphoserine phosphatase
MRTLFIDFDGTICADRFWRNSPEYMKIQQSLFTENSQVAADWMRGIYTSEQINQLVSEQTGILYQILWDTFESDCKTMSVPVDILDIVLALQNDFYVVLITGNMDSFSRFTSPALQLELYFDEIVNSYDERQLKTDNGGETFLKYCQGDISNAILVEDSQKTIEVFRSLGGVAHQTDSLEKTLEILHTLK